jgi:type IV fimbrial biogenesis protein FimT
MMKKRVKERIGERGFSLVELLITVVILAVLAAIAVPAFSQIIARNRLATAANELLWILKVARAEAIKSGYRTVICASADQINCSGSWHDGWMLFIDRNRTAKPSSPASILHVRGAFAKAVTISGNGKIKSNIAYQPNGQLGAISGLLQNGTFSLSVEGGKSLQIVISTSGRPHVVRE